MPAIGYAFRLAGAWLRRELDLDDFKCLKVAFYNDLARSFPDNSGWQPARRQDIRVEYRDHNTAAEEVSGYELVRSDWSVFVLGTVGGRSTLRKYHPQNWPGSIALLTPDLELAQLARRRLESVEVLFGSCCGDWIPRWYRRVKSHVRASIERIHPCRILPVLQDNERKLADKENTEALPLKEHLRPQRMQKYCGGDRCHHSPIALPNHNGLRPPMWEFADRFPDQHRKVVTDAIKHMA